VRLYISPYTPELHDLRWETLRDPQETRWLATGEKTLFSRYLITADWGDVPPRPGGPGADAGGRRGVRICWGTVEEFLTLLTDKYNARVQNRD
jgi:hypothetical protein